jgi:hypothetical protein
MCPDCQRFNPPEQEKCDCGRRLLAPAKSRVPMYLAAIPLIFPLYFMLHALSSSFLSGEAQRASQFCIGTYGVKLSETQVLTGMARNSCQHPVEGAHLAITVVDERGNRRVESIAVKALEPGAEQRFERVLGGRMRSWEIASDK